MADELKTGSAASGEALYANIVQSALFTLNEQSIIRPLVRTYDMTGTPGLTAQVPVYPTVSAAGVADGTDLSNTAFATTKKEITASEVGVMVTLTDLLEEASNDDTAAAVGRQLGAAMAEKVDTDLAALFTGFSNSVGAVETEITVDDMFKAAATLRNNKAPGPYVAVLHPYQAFQLKKLLAGNGNTPMNNHDLANEALRTGYVGQIAGIQIFESTVITGPDSAGDGFIGAAMSADALGYMVKRSMRIETQRDASLRATEIVGSMAYGTSELIDAYGVKIIADAAL